MRFRSLPAWFAAAGMVPAAAVAQGVHPVSDVTATTVLTTLLLCGLMGLLGQGCRVIVGMTTLATTAPPGEQDRFNLARLVFSLIVGFLAGVVSALADWKMGPIAGINVSDFDTMFGFAIAGYIGTDIVEAFTVQFFEKRRPDDAPDAHIVAPIAPEQIVPVADDTLGDLRAMISAIADTIGDATSPIGKFKTKAPSIMAQLISDFGLADFQAAGILGNLGVECNGFTQLQEQNPVGGGPGGYGWAQWTGPRRTQYFAWCQDNQLDTDSDAANYGFLKHELTTGYQKVITSLINAATVSDATTVFLHDYERAGVPASARRISWANIALAAFKAAAG